MTTHYETSLQRDIERIRGKVLEMSGLAEGALKLCVQALTERSRQKAYSIILRDQLIDELEKEIDRLCLEFLVRQQPVARPLRFVYSTIRINLELERIGDYAESIARQILKIAGSNGNVPTERLVALAHLVIPMLHDAVRAFVDQNAELAGKTMATEEAADALRNQINAELIRLEREGKIPLEALNPLLTIARRFERVSDQAKNICQETLYMCTGEYAKHPGAEAFRLLFVDAHHACLSQMAEGIGHSLSQPKFIFSSAGLDPRPLDAQTAAFLREKGVEPPRQTPRAIHQVPNLDYYQIIVGLAKDVSKALPPPPRKTVYLEWTLDDPSSAAGTPAEVRAAYEAAYQTLHAHIQDLVEAILGDEIE